MEFHEVLDQIVALLRHRKRVAYGAIKRQFNLDDSALEELKDAILFAYPQVIDENQRGLVCEDELPASTTEASRQDRVSPRWRLVFPAITAWLERECRVTYTERQLIFGLDDTGLKEVTRELVFKQLARDERGEGLVWDGAAFNEPNDIEQPRVIGNRAESSLEPARLDQVAERRQLTVMFCDLVGSTDLSGRLDPEDFRDVVRAYQETAAEVIQQYDGYIAQYLGDGLLIYFGFPIAHERDAERAVYTGLGISEAVAALNSQLEADYDVQLAVRMGIHTGPVVVGEMGGGGRHENLAMGETPNIAARLEGLAQPNTAVISPVTAQLVQRSFALENLGSHELKGVAEPMMLYAVMGSREAEHDDHEGLLAGGFDALVGRDGEIGLLLRRWEQSKEGQGLFFKLVDKRPKGGGKPGLIPRGGSGKRFDTRLDMMCLHKSLFPPSAIVSCRFDLNVFSTLSGLI